MTATLISPSGTVLHHRARRSTTPEQEGEAKAVRVWYRAEVRLEENRSFLKYRNVRAFLRAVSETLGREMDFRQGAVRGRVNDPWRFQDFSTHPGAGADGVSTDAGAYAITVDSWLDLGSMMGLSDFSAETQDLIAVEMLRKRGIADKLQAGDVWSALLEAGSDWPGLPRAPGADGRFAPPASEYERFCALYKCYGGTINELAGALGFGHRNDTGRAGCA